METAPNPTPSNPSTPAPHTPSTYPTPSTPSTPAPHIPNPLHSHPQAAFTAGAEERRRAKEALSRSLEEAYGRLLLYGAGAEGFAAEDEATHATLMRHALRTTGACGEESRALGKGTGRGGAGSGRQGTRKVARACIECAGSLLAAADLDLLQSVGLTEYGTRMWRSRDRGHGFGAGVRCAVPCVSGQLRSPGSPAPIWLA